MSVHKDQKFFPGDTIKIIDPRYPNHRLHIAVITKAQFVWSSKSRAWKRMEYIVQCKCGFECSLTGSSFVFIPDPYTPLSTARLQHFLSKLGIRAEDNQPHLITLMDILTEQQKDIITRRYGLNGLGNETLQSIAADYGLTRERVRQVEQQSIEKITRLLEHHADRAEALTIS